MAQICHRHGISDATFYIWRSKHGGPRGPGGQTAEGARGRRNETLDQVYARAAAAIFGLDWFEERHWRHMEEASKPWMWPASGI
jgi:hypothetical protein